MVSLLAVGDLIVGTPAHAAELDKSAGVGVAGKNDCGAPVSSCAGAIKQDRHTDAWVVVPKGTCSKIAGGTVTIDAMNKHGVGVSR